MTEGEWATEGFIDREILRVRGEIKALYDLWQQKEDSNALQLVLHTAEVSGHLDDLNHAHARARDIQETTVTSTRYEEQMADLRLQLQGVKDAARESIVTAVADLTRQVTKTQQTAILATIIAFLSFVVTIIRLIRELYA